MPKAASKKSSLPQSGGERVVIESVSPIIDCGRFALKRIVGDEVIVEADAFADGHDVVACVLCVRSPGGRVWTESRMMLTGNDRFRGVFAVTDIGSYAYTVRAYIDRFGSLCRELARRPLDDPDLAGAWAQGAALIAAAAAGAQGLEADALREAESLLRSDCPAGVKRQAILDEVLAQRVTRFTEPRYTTRFAPELKVTVDSERARHSAWYEFFPRSVGDLAHGRLRDAGPMLAYIASMGFDVVYLPPISPIGESLRKGPNNTRSVLQTDVGSPWAIGSMEGGHKAVAKALGTLDDFRAFRKQAEGYGLDVALDMAFQCAPDHPYVKEHPQWFRHRPDGTIQYAENPPKKYQDIYPLDFETEDWRALWQELKSVVIFWIEQGIRLFRVDNPHTKAFAFWEWLIADVKEQYPEVLFLAEAFTRPKVMHRLAKLGFSHSYTYFTWRNTKRELTEYFSELAHGEGRHYFRPHVWPNTPDILPGYLQYAPRAAFAVRLVLAATLSANYGVYGPAFELMDNIPSEMGSEEYLNSEKYQRRHWAIDSADSLRDLIARMNRIRRDTSALQSDHGLRFHAIDNENLICYSKATDDMTSVVVIVVNLDPHHRQSGWLEWPADRLGSGSGRPVQMHDLLSDARYIWTGTRHYVELAPEHMPAHILCVRQHIRSEHEFDYYS
ncbi:MAG: alpha-1,4-glucan--maltose-1-phosphate maltosyltransferase [Acidiferrobacter sp.]